MNSNTVMVGLFGQPVGHSMSPDMHNAAFKHLGLNFAYAAFSVSPSNLKEAVYGIRALGFRGLNVTIPHKVEVMPYLDEIDLEAADIGAVNTIVNEDGHLIGYNTDGPGYLQSLIEETGFNPVGKNVVILGAGGASRAVAMSLARAGAEKIVIANRTEDKGSSLAEDVSVYTRTDALSFQKLGQIGLDGIHLLINTTSVGMYPNINESPIQSEMIHSGLLVSDLIYNPLQTKLLQNADKNGAQIHNGIGMFVHQGALAFQKWTGYEAPIPIMKKIVLERLNQTKMK